MILYEGKVSLPCGSNWDLLRHRGGKHSPYFVQVPPKFHLRGIGAEFDQVPPQEHLPSHDLGTLLRVKVFDWSLVGSVTGVEGARSDVLFQELLIDDVDNGRDQGFDVLGARGEGLDVGWNMTVRSRAHLVGKERPAAVEGKLPVLKSKKSRR